MRFHLTAHTVVKSNLQPHFEILTKSKPTFHDDLYITLHEIKNAK